MRRRQKRNRTVLSEDALFTVSESIGIAMVATLLVYLAMAIISFGNSGNPPASALLLAVQGFVNKLRYSEWWELFNLIVFLAIPTGIFRGTRYHPLVVARLIAWFTASYLTVLPLVLPLSVGRLVRHLTSTADAYLLLSTSLDSTKCLFSMVIGLALICFAGEFYQIASERSMNAEWQRTESVSAAAGGRLRRHHELILAVRGGRMPMTGAVARFLPLIVLSPLFSVFIVHFVETHQIFGIEKELPAPPLLSPTNSKYPPQTLRVSIANDGSVSFDDHFTIAADETDFGKLADALQTRRKAEGKAHLVLQVAPEATYQRLIDLLNLAARIRLPVVIEDVDN